MPRHPFPLTTAFLVLAVASGCATPEPACRALVAASPADWPTHWQAIAAHGPSAAPILIQELRANPDGPGAQAAVHLLGELGGAVAGAYLSERLRDGTSLATEAALALGRLGDRKQVSLLQAVVIDANVLVTTRVAAAAALIDLGEARGIAGFLEAVFLAASPHGTASTAEYRLPTAKTRWAHERYLLIEALRRRYDGRTFGLDEDASWGQLRNAAGELRKFLER